MTRMKMLRLSIAMKKKAWILWRKNVNEENIFLNIHHINKIIFTARGIDSLTVLKSKEIRVKVDESIRNITKKDTVLVKKAVNREHDKPCHSEWRREMLSTQARLGVRYISPKSKIFTNRKEIIGSCKSCGSGFI